MERSLRTSRLAAATLALGLAASLLVALSPGRAGAAIPYPDTERISGGSAVEAGIGVSKRLYGNGEAESVVLVRKDKFPDGLAAAGIAGEFNGPVLFSSSSSLDSATEAELRRVLPEGKTVYLMGGKAALSDAVANKLSGDYTVRRADGTDRVHTAALAAIRYTRSGPNDTAILVRGYGSPGQDNTEGWVDAISCGGFAADNGTPILLTNNTVDQVHQHTLDALSQLNIRTVSICGGFGAVPKSQSDQLLKLGYSVNRYAGTTRIGTAVDVANRLWGKGGSTVGDHFILVNGWSDNFAYGIAASPLSASLNAPILLVNNNDPSSYVPGDCPNPPNVNHETLCYLDNRGSDRIGSLAVVGSTALVSDAVFAAAAEAGGLPKDTQPPSVPADAAASDTPEDDGTHLDVSWKASTDNVGGPITYTVYVREPSDDDMTIANSTKAGTVTDATSLTIGGLTADTDYETAVTATDQFGNTSALSAPSAAATPTDEVPATPENAPNAANQSGPAVLVSWLAGPEADVDGYEVERASPGALTDDCSESALGGASYEVVAQIEGRSTTSYRDEDVSAGDELCYRYRKIDTTDNESGASPAAAITVNEVSNDTTPPAGTPSFYAVNYDQQEGLIDGSSGASKTEKATNRFDVVVPAGAYTNGEGGKVILYVDGEASQEEGFVATGGEQIVSVPFTFQSTKRSAELEVTLADLDGNQSSKSPVWSLTIDPQAPATPRIVLVDGVNTDPLDFEDERIPVVGATTPRVDQTPRIVVAGLSPTTAQAQRVDIFHQGVRVTNTCFNPSISSTNRPPSDGRVTFENVSAITGTNNFVAVLTTRNSCSGFGSTQTGRSGDSNTVKYNYNAASFGVTDSFPSAGSADFGGYENDDFFVTFNKPAAVGSKLELRRTDTGAVIATKTISGSAASTITIDDTERTDPLPAGPWELKVTATAADNSSQSSNASIPFNSGFVHLVYVSAAVSPDTNEPNNTGDVDDGFTQPGNEADYNLTLVATSGAPTGRYYVEDLNGDQIGQFDHVAGEEDRSGVRNEDPANYDGDAGEGFQWIWRNCVPDSEDPTKNCDSLETQNTGATQPQADGALPKASTVNPANLGLRQDVGNAYRFAGVSSLPAGDHYEVLYRPTQVTASSGSSVFETTFRAPEQVIRHTDGSAGIADNASVRPGYEVRYWVRNVDNGNESTIVMDGILRGLTEIFPTNGLGNTENLLESGDSLVLEFSQASFSGTMSDDNTVDGGVQIFTGTGDSVKEIQPHFEASSGSASASRDFASAARFVITFGSATTLGGQAVPQAVSSPTQVHGGLSWFGVNWALDKSEYSGRSKATTGGVLADHAVLLPPSDAPKSVNSTF